MTEATLVGALRAGRQTSSNPTPPLHVLKPDGAKGRISAYRCSCDCKRRILTRQVKALPHWHLLHMRGGR